MRRTAPLALLAALPLCGAWLACRDEGPPPIEPPDPDGEGAPSISSPSDLPFAPGPRAAVDGLAGLRAVSRCTFPGGATQRLEAWYQFPGRVRWQVDWIGPPRRFLLREYRFGERVFGEERGATGSVEYPPDRRDNLLRGQALRRAALLWPSTYAWEDTGAGSARVALAGIEAGTTLGFIEAELDSDQRAARLVVHLPDGRPQEALTILAWRRQGDREIPARLSLASFESGREVPVWTEEIERWDVDVTFVDEVFLPPDRQPSPPAQPPTVEEVRLEAATWRELPWPAAAESGDWPERWALAEEVLRGVAVPEGAEIDPFPAVLLDSEGRPAGILARLLGSAPAPGGNWHRTPERTGLSVRFPRPETFDPSWVRVLVARAGARAGSPYARPIPGAGAGSGLQLVVPLEPQ